MKNNIVRLLSIELINFKNIEYGKIEMPSLLSEDYSFAKSEIMGIYGQNGSGKTAVIDALLFLKHLLWGISLPKDAVNYILKSSDSLSCIFKFYLRKESLELLVDYSFTLSKSSEDSIFVSAEKISYKLKKKNSWATKVDLLNYSSENEDQLFSPQFRWNEIISSHKENRVDLGVAKKISLKENKSFLFSHDVISIVSKNVKNCTECSFILNALQYYAVTGLFVIRNEHSGAISLNLALPFAFKQEDEKGGFNIGDLTISLSEPTLQSLAVYKMFSNIIFEMNSVIHALIPGMKLEIKEYGEQTLKDGKDGMRFEVLSVRGSSRIPIKYESEGIKKILSILNIIISMYNNTSVCIAIDEFDAGIYEYLLGELLSIIEEGGKGQMIFTSHNLRPLEMIDKCAIVFTTTNPKNRYMRLTNVKSNNNLRDLYLRSINLGGQKETVYETTNSFEISRALRKAGKKAKEDEQYYG